MDPLETKNLLDRIEMNDDGKNNLQELFRFHNSIGVKQLNKNLKFNEAFEHEMKLNTTIKTYANIGKKYLEKY